MLQVLEVLDRVIIIVESRNCGKEEGRGVTEVLLLLYIIGIHESHLFMISGR